ncbi:MAG: nucleotide exchange factor GrpE [Nanoarchaeota archaeon]|nr:nucleotide exchange factor GrpE [Nanoarchaeota archaeon]
MSKIKKQLEKDIKKPKENNLAEEYLNDLKRLKAEFENYQKRTEKEKIEFCKYASESLILKLLNTLDDFERALENSPNDDFAKGVNLILTNFKKILEQEGVKLIKETHFNPYKHEALAHEEGEENKILEEFQKGYTLHDKTIRPSKVKVGKKK